MPCKWELLNFFFPSSVCITQERKVAIKKEVSEKVGEGLHKWRTSECTLLFLVAKEEQSINGRTVTHEDSNSVL